MHHRIVAVTNMRKAACGVCSKPMIASRRGRNRSLVYICREHRERGDASCANATGVPAADLHVAVITSLRSSFTEQSLVEHLERQASNTTARAQREAERATLLAELPRLAAAEQRLVRRIATIEDDTLVAALKDEWALAKDARESAERRVTALEGIERDLRADRAEIEVLLETWKGWSNILAQVGDTPSGSIPAEAQVIARQVLKKVPTGPIAVTPGVDCWTFQGTSRIDRVLQGAVAQGESVVVRYGQRPIVGGSDDGGFSAVASIDMAPAPPGWLGTPRRSRGVPRDSHRPSPAPSA